MKHDLSWIQRAVRPRGIALGIAVVLTLAASGTSTAPLRSASTGFTIDGIEIPRYIAGYEVVLVVTPEEFPCLPVADVFLAGLDPSPETFLSGTGPKSLAEAFASLGFATGEVMYSVGGPETDKEGLVKEIRDTLTSIEAAGCPRYGGPRGFGVPSRELGQ